MKLKLLSIVLLFPFFSIAQKNSVLVFSKTAGYRHESIKEGQEFFSAIAKQQGFILKLSEDANDINEKDLKNYNAVVFLNTTGDILDPVQQADFERYIQAGGGFMGIHAATDCEYTWPWYNNLVGGQFASHPGGDVSNVQSGKMNVIDASHPATKHLPASFNKTDEFYDFKNLKKDILKFLISVDESSYKMGKMGDFHPMAWYHDYDGGKVFYSNFGHTSETFSEPLITQHFKAGLNSVWATKLDYSKVKTERAPEENRFVRTILSTNLNEPTELAIMPNGKVVYVERKGAVKIWNPKNNTNKIAAQFNVYNKFEYGLMGVGLDPKFEQNNWIYFYYSPVDENETQNYLSRFTYNQAKDTIDLTSEKILLKVNVKRIECCHTGGSIDWDSKGNLFLSTGDDTNPFASDGYAPIDFRKDRRGWDALSTSGNTNDLRGKILRITPQNDGTYTIPDGNLFDKNDEKARPEIYVMGNRNPYRIAVDKTTDFLYWGEVGPDAGKTDSSRGPEGIVEFNQARKAGNFGWPMFTGDNFAYNAYDFDTKKSGPKFDPGNPINNSTNNTGLNKLPPTQKPMIWYGYDNSSLFPKLGKGGANPMGGPVFHSSEYKKSKSTFPKYFDNKFFAYEWMRDWIMLVEMDKDGNYKSMEQFMPNTKFYHPMDMAFSNDGVLYVLDYGMSWFAQNQEATLSRIVYNAGNRTPLVKTKADITEGAAPLLVNFNSEGTIDYDNDKLSYLWTFGKNMAPSNLKNPKIKFNKPGNYEVKLLVKDDKGNQNTSFINIKVGNELPKIDINIKSNKSFAIGDNIDYEVLINDKEDGKLGSGIKAEDVMVSIDYIEGYDKTMLEQGHKSNENFTMGRRLIEKSDCAACHQNNKKSIGPSYQDIAGKYKKTTENINLLSSKIINGGGGVWGEQAMAAHPQLSKSDSRDIVDYILSINDKQSNSKPLKGTHSTAENKSKKEGAYIIKASYTDKGGKIIGPLSNSKVISINSPILKAGNFDFAEKTQKFDVPGVGELLIAIDDSYAKYNSIDLNSINNITISSFSRKGSTVGGKIEIRQKSKEGNLIAEVIVNEGDTEPKKVLLNNKLSSVEDLFFVFKNPDSGGRPLFGLSKIEFEK